MRGLPTARAFSALERRVSDAVDNPIDIQAADDTSLLDVTQSREFLGNDVVYIAGAYGIHCTGRVGAEKCAEKCAERCAAMYVTPRVSLSVRRATGPCDPSDSFPRPQHALYQPFLANAHRHRSDRPPACHRHRVAVPARSHARSLAGTPPNSPGSSPQGLASLPDVGPRLDTISRSSMAGNQVAQKPRLLSGPAATPPTKP